MKLEGKIKKIMYTTPGGSQRIFEIGYEDIKELHLYYIGANAYPRIHLIYEDGKHRMIVMYDGIIDVIFAEEIK